MRRIRQEQISGNNNFTSLREELLTLSKDAKVYLHEQSTPSKIWLVEHQMGKRPKVTIIDSEGDAVWTKVHYDSINTITITFSEEMVGIVICQ